MALRLSFTARAAREVRAAAEWWAVHRPAAAGAVRSDLTATLDLLRERPGLGAAVEQASAPGVRRFYLDRIRYWVYYRVRVGALEVLSLWHASRGSGPSL